MSLPLQPTPNATPSRFNSILGTRGRIKLVIAVLALCTLGIFNLFLDRGPSTTEVAFSSWIASLERNAPVTSDSHPTVTVRIISNLSRGSFDWSVGGTPKDSAAALRSLELLKEAHLRSLRELAPGEEIPSASSGVVVVASDGLKRFIATFYEQSLEKSIQLQNFMKLTQLLHLKASSDTSKDTKETH